MKKITFLSALVGIIMLFAVNANAHSVDGIAVAGVGETDDLAVVNSNVTKNTDGKYEYFIHLGEDTPSQVSGFPAVSHDGTYGVTTADANGNDVVDASDAGTYGTFSDRVKLTTSEQINGPLLTMNFLLTVPDNYIGTSVTIWNDDLDLALSNDPSGPGYGFFEDITLYGQLGLPGTATGTTYTTWGQIDGLTNVTVNPLPMNNSIDGVGITFSGLNLSEGNNYFKVGFSSYSEGFGYGTWYNTKELISVSMNVEAVPEPATIALLGIGIVGFAGAAARKKFRKSQNK